MKIALHMHLNLSETVANLFGKMLGHHSMVTSQNEYVGHGFKQVKMNLWCNFHVFTSYIGSVVES